MLKLDTLHKMVCLRGIALFDNYLNDVLPFKDLVGDDGHVDDGDLD